MSALLKDPVVLICSGILVFGLLALFWAIAKFRRLSSGSKGSELTDTFAPAADDMLGLDFAALSARTVSPVVPPAAAVSKDVAERLESMTQRLAEMQAALTRQSANAAAETAGAVGQGFSPETIDKLLKIIGNVIQQVDILQKSVAPPKETPKLESPVSPTGKP